MNLPAKARILGADFSVYRMPCSEECGHTNVGLRTICVDPHMPEDTQGETYYHEVVHAILGLSGVSSILGDGQEEAVAQAIGYGLWRFVNDNAILPKGKR